MKRIARLGLLALIACVMQTTLARYVRIGGVAPDFMIVFLVLATKYTGPYGGFCMGALIALLYEGTVGYVPIINLVSYTAIGIGASFTKNFFGRYIPQIKGKNLIELVCGCLLWTFLREVVYIGFLYLFGSDVLNPSTLWRMGICCVYSAALVLPCMLISDRVMQGRLRGKPSAGDEEQDAEKTHAVGGKV